jgi:hypothetical protein
MVFNYAVDASWERPVKMPPSSLEDFPRTASSIEPFNIDVVVEANSLYYNPDLIGCPKSGGILRLLIDVASWQGPEGISEVLVGSPDLGVDFTPAQDYLGGDFCGAYVSTFIADLVPQSFQTSTPDVIIVAKTTMGSYWQGPDKTEIEFNGTPEDPLALYELYTPFVQSNSPPVVGSVVGPETVIAGEFHVYNVWDYWDCQDLNENLSFAWEMGDDFPPAYDDGYGVTTPVFQWGNGIISYAFKEGGPHRVDVRVTDMNGAAGYSELPLDVDVALPERPEFPVSGVNLELTLKRTIIYSYEYTINPNDVPSIELSWYGHSVTGHVAEWVIYWDANPYDGIDNWEEVDTTPGPQWNYSIKLTGAPGYYSGGAYMFKVTARSLMGNADTESLGSTEYAFIEFENAEPSGPSVDLYPWSMGYGGVTASYFRQWERPGEDGAVAGSCWMMDPDSPYMRSHTWSVIASPPLPILTDPDLAATTEEWVIELIFGAQIIPMNECWLPGQTLSVGTVPDDPALHNGATTYFGYDEAPPGDFIDGTPYYPTMNWWYLNSRFDETPSTYLDRHGWGKNEYGFPFNFARFKLLGLDPNGVGRVRAAIGFGSGAYDDALCRPRADEIAVIIY